MAHVAVSQLCYFALFWNKAAITEPPVTITDTFQEIQRKLLSAESWLHCMRYNTVGIVNEAVKLGVFVVM